MQPHIEPMRPRLLRCIPWVLFLLASASMGCTDAGAPPPSQTVAYATGAAALTAAQALPPPGANDTVQIFNRHQGKWHEGRLREVEPDGELIHEGRLFRLRGQAGTLQWIRDIDVSKLAEADASFEPSARHRAPEADDVVWVLERDARHSRLTAVRPGEKFAFQGRIFESMADAGTGTLQVRHTGNTLNRVVKTLQRPANTLIDLTLLQSGSNRESTLSGTPEHPFFLPALGRYVPLGQLRPGDLLLTSDGSQATVVASNLRHGVHQVFNFEVEHVHNYFVSTPGTHEPGVLVHNTCVIDDVIQETQAAAGNLTSRHTLSADEALEAGQRWLGRGYREIGEPNSGVFRSADGARQFRIDNGSIQGAHPPGVAHVHLERVAPDGRTIIANNHIPFTN
jgi:hypothetical protein